jgi:hypothetical protein
MRRLILSISILLGAACTPGSGEYGPCGGTADCQVGLFCTSGTALVADGGNTYVDGGVCRYDCPPSTCSTFSEICGTNGLCSKDGGY